MAKKSKRPNKAEKKFLQLAYSKFYDIFNEVMADDFWKERSEYRFNRIKQGFFVYAELLDYEPIGLVIEHIKKTRPPMEGEVGSELFKFIRNVVVHFPYFERWDDVWVDKDVVNWNKEGRTIDRLLTKYEGRAEVKYRVWFANQKEMMYLGIKFPKNYSGGEKVFLKDMLSEKRGVLFAFLFMKKILNTQVEE